MGKDRGFVISPTKPHCLGCVWLYEYRANDTEARQYVPSRLKTAASADVQKD
jgi:hypothetical protein